MLPGPDAEDHDSQAVYAYFFLFYSRTTSEVEAEGKLREIYEGDRKSLGYVPNHAKVFSLRPEVLEAWRAFQGSIRKNLRLRRYELITLAAAMALKCRYCLLAHGAILIKNGVSVDQLRRILTNFDDAGLERAEVAMMEFAQKIIRNANEITQADIDSLRAVDLRRRRNSRHYTDSNNA